MEVVGWARGFFHQILRHMLLYVLRTRNNTIYGHDAFLDIARLSKLMEYGDGAIIDVGANSGQTTLRLLREFPNGQIYSFEPHPQTFAKLRHNVRKFNNVVAIKAALGPRNGTAELFAYDNCALSSVVANSPFVSRFGVRGNCITVNIGRLDDFCSNNKITCIHTLKIDTEGYDLEVLRGATRMLAQGQIKFVYIEFNDLFEIADVTGGSLINIAEFLRQWGYRFVASYMDYVEPVGDFFISSNALFVLPPRDS